MGTGCLIYETVFSIMVSVYDLDEILSKADGSDLKRFLPRGRFYHINNEYA